MGLGEAFPNRVEEQWFGSYQITPQNSNFTIWKNSLFYLHIFIRLLHTQTPEAVRDLITFVSRFNLEVSTCFSQVAEAGYAFA